MRILGLGLGLLVRIRNRILFFRLGTYMAALARLKNRAWRLRRYPEGLPTLDDFELFDNTSETPATLDCGHVLLKTAFISVDPYMRTRMKPG